MQTNVWPSMGLAALALALAAAGFALLRRRTTGQKGEFAVALGLGMVWTAIGMYWSNAWIGALGTLLVLASLYVGFWRRPGQK